MARPSRPPRRRTSSGPQPLRLLAFVEGLRTEEDYLKHLWRPHREHLILVIDPFRGTPMALVERAISTRRAELHDQTRGRGRASDEVWCMFDFDEHPHVREAIDLAQRHNINVATSNPCTELWFILHHEDQTAHIERHAAQRRARELLGCGKHLTSDALATLDPLYADAVRRAKQLDRKHAGDGSPPRSNPSSDVWRLAERIRNSSRR